MKTFLKTFLFLLFCLAVLPISAESEDTSFHYRYWMVPADKISSIPWGSDKYCPVSLDRFEAWIQAFRKQEDRKANGTEGLVRLSLEANFNKGALNAGEGELLFSSDIDEARPFILTPCSLAVSAFRGENYGGLSAGSDGTHPIVIRNIRKESTVKFNWSLAPQITDENKFVYSFQLPPASSTELFVTLPIDLTPDTDTGIVTQMEGGGAASQKWRIEPGPGGCFNLTLRKNDLPSKEKIPPNVSETSVCRVSLEGVEMTYTASFDSADGLPDTLSLLLDEPFLPEKIFWESYEEETDAVWEKSGQNQKIILLVPKFSQNETPKLTLTAFAPFTSGDSLSIPTVHTDPNEILWKETDIHVSFETPVTPDDYIFHNSGRVFSTEQQGETMAETTVFQLFERDGSVEIPLSRTEEKILIESGTEIQRGEGEIRFRTELLLRANLPGVRRLTIPIKPEWKTETAVLNGEPISFRTGKEDDGTSSITLAFNDPIPTSEARRVLIEGRCEITDSGVPISQFSPFFQLPNQEGTHFIAIQTDTPTKVTLIDSTGKTVSPAAFDEEKVRDIFGQIPNGTILSVENTDSDILVRFDKTVPAYTADITGRVTVTAEKISEEWILRCTPSTGARVYRILTLFTELDKSISDWKWSMTESGTGKDFQLTEARLTDPERKGFGLEERQLVGEISLPTPRSAPFTVRISREQQADFSAELPVPLLCLLDTQNQTSEIEISSPDFSPISPKTIQMLPISSPLPENGTAETSLGVYSYVPSDLLHSSRQTPHLTLLRSENRLSRGWCRFLRVETEYSPDGMARNQITCFLENAGLSSIRIHFPKPFTPASIKSILRDGVPIKFGSVEGEAAPTVEIPLVPNKKYAVLTMEYNEEIPVFKFKVSLPKRIPKLSIPVLSGDWITRIPTEYEPSEKAASFLDSAFSLINGTPKKTSSNNVITKRADDLLTQIGTAPKQLTWRELLTLPKYIPALLNGSREVLVSRSVMEELKIEPDSLIPVSEKQTPAARGADILQQSGAVFLIAAPNLCYVTRQDKLGQNVSSASSVLCSAIRAAEEDLQSLPDDDFEPVSEWCGIKKDQSSKTDAADPQPISLQPAKVPGHTVISTPLEVSSGRTLVNSSRLAVFKWFLFLAVTAVGIHFRPLNNGLLSIAFFILFISTKSLPAAALSLSLFLGFGTALLFSLARPHTKEVFPQSDDLPTAETPEPDDAVDESECGFVLPEQRPASTAASQVIGTVILFAFLLSASYLYADSEKSFPIFIPSENKTVAEGQPAWIPESLYRRMSEWEYGSLAAGGNARIESALYEGHLNYNHDTGDYSLFRLAAKYRLITDGSEASLRLPMMPIIPEGGILIDGAVGNILFSEENGELHLDIRKLYPGIHSLDLILLPSPFNEKEETGTTINIPSAPDSKLILRLPSDVPAPQVEGGLGEVSQSPGILTADLGQTRSFTLKPPVNAGKHQDNSAEAEQSFLLQAGESQTLLRGEFRVRISGGKCDGLTILTDPHYIMTRCVCGDIPLLPIFNYENGSSDRVRIPFKKPVSGNITLLAEFVPRDFSGVGEIPLPLIRVADTSITKNELRIAAAPEIDAAVAGIEGLLPSDTQTEPESISAAPFSQTGLPPGFREIADIDLTKPESEAKRLSLRPVPAKPVFTESGSYTFHSQEVKIDYNANIETKGSLFLLTLKAPKNFIVDSVSISNLLNQEEIPLRFSSEETSLRLFFEHPLHGKYQLNLKGGASYSSSTEILFPLAGISGIPCESSDISFVCADSLYSVFNTPGSWTALPTQTPRIRRWSIPQPASETIPPSIEIKVNRPNISVLSETFFFPCLDLPNTESGSPWELLSNISVNLMEGELEKLEFDIDDSFRPEDISIESKTEFTKQITHSEAGGRVLVLAPSVPIRENVRLCFHGRIYREDIRLPKFRFHWGKILPQEERKFFLPIRNREINLNWKTETAAPAEPPASSQMNPPQGVESYFSFGSREFFPKLITERSTLKREDFIKYEPSNQEDFSALAVTEKDAPDILGMETSFILRKDGSYYGQTIVDVRFDESSECDFIVPENIEILQAMVDGIPAAITNTGKNKIRLNFIHEFPVCRIHILFDAKGNLHPQQMKIAGHRYTKQKLQTVQLAGTVYHGSLWSAAFELPANQLPYYVNQYGAEESGEISVQELRSTLPADSQNSSLPETGHWKRPISLGHAGPIWVRLNMAKMTYMLNILENIYSASGTADKFTPKNWLTRWLSQWQPCYDEVSSYFKSSDNYSSFNDEHKNALFIKLVNSETRSVHDVSADLEKLLNGVARQNYDNLVTRYQELSNLGHIPNHIPTGNVPNTGLDSLHFSAAQGEDAGILFGLTNTEASAIVIYKPEPEMNSGFRGILWVIAVLFIITALFFGKSGLIQQIKTLKSKKNR